MVQERTRDIRVGFILDPDSNNWIGGVHYFKNLFYAISIDSNSRIHPVVLTIDKGACTHYFPEVESIPFSFADCNNKYIINIVRKIFQTPSLASHLLRGYVKKHHIDVLSHTAIQSQAAGIPTIGWIPDFQEKYLPEFFSEQEIAMRERSAQNLIRESTLTLFSSQSAKGDAMQYYPKYQDKYVVLHFVATFFGTDYSYLTDDVITTYDLSHDYFYCPNQLWKHKNHMILIEALTLLKNEGINAQIVCSGSQSDYRNPMYFDELFSKVKAYELEDQFRYLGQIPYEDVLSLMLHTRAMINPSFFEGWSSSVEEAKSLGIPIILSDLPVHREQNPYDALYFSPNNPEELAECIKESIYFPKNKRIKEQQGILMDRTIQYARNYESIIIQALEKYSHGP